MYVSDYVALCCPRVHHARVHRIVRNAVHVCAVRMLIKRPLPANVMHPVKIVNINSAFLMLDRKTGEPPGE